MWEPADRCAKQLLFDASLLLLTFSSMEPLDPAGSANETSPLAPRCRCRASVPREFGFSSRKCLQLDVRRLNCICNGLFLSCDSEFVPLNIYIYIYIQATTGKICGTHTEGGVCVCVC